MPKKDLRKAYNVWAEAAGVLHDTEIETLAANVFGGRLSDIVDYGDSKRSFEGSDRRLNCYVGLKLTEEGERLLEVDPDE